MAERKGYLYAFLAVLFFSVWSISSTKSFQYYNFLTTAVLWFGCSAIFSTGYILLAKRKEYFDSIQKHWKMILTYGTFNAINVISSFYALSVLGPALQQFLGKLSILSVLIFGILILKERFNRYEAISAVTIIAGVITISFATGDLILPGIIATVIFAVASAFEALIVKSKFQEVDSFIITNYRAVMVFFLVTIVTFVTGNFIIETTDGLIYATLPSLLTVIVAHMFIFKAYKLIDMSKVSLIGSLNPFIVMFFSYFIFGEVLNLRQFAGGMIIMLGVIGLIYFKNGKYKKKK